MCSGHNSHKALLVFINVNLPLKLFCSSFLVVVPINNGCFLIYKFSWRFPEFLGFRFLPQSIFKKAETTENFYKLIFRGMNSIYLIWSTFLRILCDQDLTFKVLLKVTKENLLLKLESSFFVIKPKIVLT